jgi:hypothetical protein
MTNSIQHRSVIQVAQSTPEAKPIQAKDTGIERDAYGRFARGNRGGPGNPFARQCALLRRTLLRHTTEESVADVVARLTEMACAGNLAAIKLFLHYQLGKGAESSPSSASPANH